MATPKKQSAKRLLACTTCKEEAVVLVELNRRFGAPSGHWWPYCAPCGEKMRTSEGPHCRTKQAIRRGDLVRVVDRVTAPTFPRPLKVTKVDYKTGFIQAREVHESDVQSVGWHIMDVERIPENAQGSSPSEAAQVMFAPGTCVCAHAEEQHVRDWRNTLRCTATLQDELRYADDATGVLRIPNVFSCSCAGYLEAPPGFFEEYMRRYNAVEPRHRMVVSSPMARETLARELRGDRSAKKQWVGLPW